METKQAFATLIDAYADAKKSGNDLLMKLAVAQLQEFIATHDFIPLNPTPVDSSGEEETLE